METKESFKKLCNFYVSDIHLGTMILPYISKKLEEKNHVYTIFEKDMYKNIEKIISGLNLKEERKEEIKNIDWNKKIGKREIKKYIGNINTDNQVVFIMGDKKYIDEANKKIKKHMKKENLKKTTIVNCYRIDTFNQNMINILNSHDAILNTSGERKIEV